MWVGNFGKQGNLDGCLVVMSSSWNFSAGAVFGHFNFRAENELTKKTIFWSWLKMSSKFSNFVYLLLWLQPIRINFMVTYHINLCKTKGIFWVEYYDKLRAERKLAMSRAELKILQLELWLTPFRLRLITIIYWIYCLPTFILAASYAPDWT